MSGTLLVGIGASAWAGLRMSMEQVLVTVWAGLTMTMEQVMRVSVWAGLPMTIGQVMRVSVGGAYDDRGAGDVQRCRQHSLNKSSGRI